jgi:hypothetical protein
MTTALQCAPHPQRLPAIKGFHPQCRGEIHFARHPQTPSPTVVCVADATLGRDESRPYKHDDFRRESDVLVGSRGETERSERLLGSKTKIIRVPTGSRLCPPSSSAPITTHFKNTK